MRRIAAWLIDWLCISVWVGATAAVGVPLYLAGVLRPGGVLALNAIAAMVIVLPVVIAAAEFESRRSAATPGKRILRLRVSGPTGRPTYAQGLLRNALKVGVPWLLGHAAVYAIVLESSDRMPTPPWVWALTGAAYALPIVYLVTLFIGSGLTPYDRVARTQVRRVA
ncbi:hypothetical protein GCM10009869_00540 [Amnibacterium kyonggiense]